MITLFWLVFGAGLGALVVAAGVSLRARRKEVSRRLPVVDDAIIEQIIERGEVYVDDDEPLDLDEIGEEEDRFWSESWDEPQGEW